jgi:predicted branched-subunit amino acid permease
MAMTMTSGNISASPWTAAGFWRGFLVALPFIVSNGTAGVAMGVAYRSAGLGFVPAIMFSLLVYSATAQAVTLGLWSVPLPIAAMVGACMTMNARYLVLGGHLRQLFPDVPRRVMLPTLFLLGDASWMMTVAEADRGRRDAGYLLGASLPMAIGWVAGTALGHALPFTPHGPLAVGAAFLPLAFVVALIPTQWRGARSLLPWALSASVAVAAAGVIGQSWAMLAGGMAGALVTALGGDDA